MRIDHTALRRGHTVAGETCEIAGLGPVPVSTVQELMPDAFLAAVVTKGVDVHTVAHLGRAANAHQRTALEATRLTCTVADCNRTIGIQIDHRTPYATQPITHLTNLDPLCPHHPRLKTHHGHHLEPGTGRRRLLPPRHHPDPDHDDDPHRARHPSDPDEPHR